jgi:hypothetical protein
MTDKYKALRDAITNPVTPGAWNVHGNIFDNDGYPESVIQAQNGGGFVAVTLDFGKNNPLMREANAHYIAAANPVVITGLLAERDGLLEQHHRDSATLREYAQARDDIRKKHNELADALFQTNALLTLIANKHEVSESQIANRVADNANALTKKEAK